jgi:hypothetical protein
MILNNIQIKYVSIATKICLILYYPTYAQQPDSGRAKIYRVFGDSVVAKLTAEEANGAAFYIHAPEKPAVFPGGKKAWIQFLHKNIDPAVPFSNRAPAGTYTVVVGFNIEREGYVRNVSAKSNKGFRMEDEVIRVIKSSPDWTPAEEKGLKVGTYMHQTVIFNISKNNVTITIPAKS